MSFPFNSVTVSVAEYRSVGLPISGRETALHAGYDWVSFQVSLQDQDDLLLQVYLIFQLYLLLLNLIRYIFTLFA